MNFLKQSFVKSHSLNSLNYTVLLKHESSDSSHALNEYLLLQWQSVYQWGRTDNRRHFRAKNYRTEDKRGGDDQLWELSVFIDQHLLTITFCGFVASQFLLYGRFYQMFSLVPVEEEQLLGSPRHVTKVFLGSTQICWLSQCQGWIYHCVPTASPWPSISTD